MAATLPDKCKCGHPADKHVPLVGCMYLVKQKQPFFGPFVMPIYCECGELRAPDPPPFK